ncbi:hypothetical protein ACFLQP_02945 [Acidobacteriota bacterium]
MMKSKKKTIFLSVVITGCVLLFLASLQEKRINSVTVPVILDHNRMLIEAEFQRKDGSWRKARLWVDTGNPSFYLSEKFARDLGMDFSTDKVNPQVPPPTYVRIGGMPLNFKCVRTRVMLEPYWLFSTMHNDANLPSTVLKQYHVVFDYPRLQLTLAEPGILKPRGVRASASVNPDNGILQVDAVIDGKNLSFALDNGAAYSFVSHEVLEQISRRNPNLPRITGAVGCANMWGWWPPQEQTLPVARLPEILWGPVRLLNTGIVGVAEISPNGPSLGAWYSQKTARPVDGFLGPNAFKAFRVEIDYANKAVYFEKSADFNSHDMDIVGLTLRPEPDKTYSVIGIAKKDGKPVVDGVEPGDVLLQVENLKTTGATMGTVVDALRGRPGDIRVLVLERNGKQFRIEARVVRLL